MESTVKLYHQNGCGQCRLVEMMLTKGNIAYESHKDINEMIQLGITHTPILEVEGQRLQGPEILKWIRSR